MTMLDPSIVPSFFIVWMLRYGETRNSVIAFDNPGSWQGLKMVKLFLQNGLHSEDGMDVELEDIILLNWWKLK